MPIGTGSWTILQVGRANDGPIQRALSYNSLLAFMVCESMSQENGNDNVFGKEWEIGTAVAHAKRGLTNETLDARFFHSLNNVPCSIFFTEGQIMHEQAASVKKENNVKPKKFRTSMPVWIFVPSLSAEFNTESQRTTEDTEKKALSSNCGSTVDYDGDTSHNIKILEKETMKKLPVGIQTFADMINEGYLYVDKTRHIADLIQAGKYLFLSRPRRFGKSLLVSTLCEIFSGNKELFQGLYIHDKIEWQPHPVIVFDFNGISFNDEEVFKASLSFFLDKTAGKYDIVLKSRFIRDKFAELIEKTAEKTKQKVVILIDEYDKPIVHYIDNDIEKALKNREVLQDLFGVLKYSDAFLHFVFLTGVSKFARVSVFSDLNNLLDITLSKQFATLLGYTQNELESYFAQHIQMLCSELELKKPQLQAEIKTWYDGYSWNAKDRIYNPFSILSLFAMQRFSNYWFATGTPALLIKLIKQTRREVTEFENKTVSEIVFDSYDVDNLNIFALLFQAGYLTITHADTQDMQAEYTLNYPNFEVKQAFVTYLFDSFTDNGLEEIQPAARNLRRCLQADNLEGFMNLIRALFAKIPYPLHIEQEAYYHSLFYMISVLMGVEIDLEMLTDKGRIDGVLALADKIYIIEFKYGKAGTKMDTLTNQAIKQIRAKNYEERFMNESRPRLLLGVGFVEKKMGYKLIPPLPAS